MSKRKRQSLEKVTLYLRAGDFGTLQALYPTIGGGPAVRELVKQHLTGIEALTSTGEAAPPFEVSPN